MFTARSNNGKVGIGEKYSSSKLKRQQKPQQDSLGIPGIPGIDSPDESSQEPEPKGFYNIAKARVQKVRESASDFWDDITDRVSDLFDF